MPFVQPPPWALPTFTALIGSGGLIVGIYSFVSPVKAARVYGVELPALSQGSRSSSKKTDDHSSSAFPSPYPENASKHVAYIYAHGIRNFVTGTTILGLTAYWRYSQLCQDCKLAKLALQRCLGIVILAGTLTPMVDAAVTWQAVEEGTGTEVGKKAAKAHASRSLVWLAGGLWCLLG